MLVKFICFFLLSLPCILMFVFSEIDLELIKVGYELDWFLHISIGVSVFLILFYLLRFIFNKYQNAIGLAESDIILNKQTCVAGIFSLTLFLFFAVYLVIAYKTTDFGSWSRGLETSQSVAHKIGKLKTKRENDKLAVSSKIALEAKSQDLKTFTEKQRLFVEKLKSCNLD